MKPELFYAQNPGFLTFLLLCPKQLLFELQGCLVRGEASDHVSDEQTGVVAMSHGSLRNLVPISLLSLSGSPCPLHP